jgi:hypothetical protein
MNPMYMCFRILAYNGELLYVVCTNRTQENAVGSSFQLRDQKAALVRAIEM